MATNVVGPTGTGSTGVVSTAPAFRFDQYYPGGVMKQLLDWISGNRPAGTAPDPPKR